MKVLIRETARNKKDWSLYKLAQMMDLPQQTVYSWATGRTQPSWESMDILCTILGCGLSDLFHPEERQGYSKEKLLTRKKLALNAAYKDYKRLEMQEG